MKNIKFILPLLALALFSCSDYLDVNTSPNNLTFDQASPAKLLPGAQTSTYRVQATTMNTLGNVFMNSWTRNVQSYGNGYDNELQLVISNSFYSGIWDGTYRALKNFDAIIKYPNPDGKYNNYVAAAKICKAFYMQRIVDLYGKCPYSKAWEGSDNTTPSYDDDFAIYKDLVANLEQARALIAAADPDAEDISGVDVMLAGDMAMWNEFANSTELRLLLRMSEATDATVTAYRNTKMQSIAAGPFLSDNVNINPGYNGSTDSQATPGFFTYGRLGLIGHFNPFAQAPNQTLEEYFACDGSVMSWGESRFLEAEAAVRYPTVFTGSAQTAFNDGVADDFNRKVATMGTYLTTINTRPNFGYSAAFTTAQKLHAIMFQKWIALMGVNAIESYIDYTRTGYPLTPLSTVTTKTRKPYRLIYPTSEYVANSGNVPNVVEADVFAINAFTPFWKR